MMIISLLEPYSSSITIMLISFFLVMTLVYQNGEPNNPQLLLKKHQFISFHLSRLFSQEILYQIIIQGITTYHVFQTKRTKCSNEDIFTNQNFLLQDFQFIIEEKDGVAPYKGNESLGRECLIYVPLHIARSYFLS